MSDNHRRLLLWLLLPLGVFLIFILPWHIPQSTPIVSDSYTFGFSNITAHLGVAVILAALLAWHLADKDGSRKFTLLDGTPHPAQSWLPLLATLCAAVIAVGVIGGWWLFLPKAYFGESTYFLARLDRMWMGQKPFRDFDFEYGPWMLDAPFLLHKLVPRIPIDTSYVLCVLGSFVLGIFALSDVVRSFAVSDRLKAALIFGFAIAGINITLGIIYTPLRYIFPLWAIAYYHRQVRVDISRGRALGLKQIILAFALPLAGFGICPDTGLVTFLGILVGCIWHWRTPHRGPMLCAFAAAASAGVVAGLYGGGYFSMLLLFGGGAFNFPIFPAPYLLLFLGCVFYLLPAIGARALEGHGIETPLFASLLLALGLFIPSALGRCDPGHVFWNGLGILLLAAASLGASAIPWRRAACIGGAIVLYATMQLAFWNNNKPALRYVLTLHRQIRDNPAAFDLPAKKVAGRIAAEPGRKLYGWSKQTPVSEWFLDLLRYDKVGAPLGSGEDVDRFLKSSGRYVPEYSVAPFGGTFTLESLRRKLADLEGMNTILVPRIYFRNLQPLDRAAYAKGESELMQGLFLFPVNLSVANAPLVPETIIVRRIARDYVLETKFRDYVVLRRRNIFDR